MPTPQRLLVVMPTWLGDCVMATPTLRALRHHFPTAHITALTSGNLRPLLQPCPWVDRIITTRKPRHAGDHRRDPGFLQLTRRLASARFDLALLLPNSFRSAAMIALAGIPQRVGYRRDGRGWLLTGGLKPPRDAAGKLQVVCTRDYYLQLATSLGAKAPDDRMELHTTAADDAAALGLLRKADAEPRPGRPLVLLCPGANYGDAKIWPADRFAAVADACAREFNARIAISATPGEKRIVEALRSAAKVPVLSLPELGVSLRLLKSVIKLASVMISNDTGPRHMAIATGCPVVTIYGPTDPAWTDLRSPLDFKVQVPVPCGPCQQKRCPLQGSPDELQCMRKVTPELVMQAVRQATRPAAVVSA